MLDRSTLRRRHLRLAVVGLAVLAVVGVGAGMLTRSDDPSPVIAGPDPEAAVRSWAVPGVRDVAVVGDDVWVLVEGPGRTWTLGRLDEESGDLVEEQQVKGTTLQMRGVGDHLWIWGQQLSPEIQAALDSSTRELPAGGRSGMIHVLKPGGELTTMELGPLTSEIPIALVADGDRAWGTFINFGTNAWSFVRIRDGQVNGAPGPSAETLVLDGDRVWLSDGVTAIALDGDSGEEVERRLAGHLLGRTSDDRVWEAISDSRVVVLGEGGGRRTVLHGSGSADVVSLGDGVLVGTRWFEEPDEDPVADAELELPPGLAAGEPAPASDGRTVYYAATTLSAGDPTGKVYRWHPSRDRTARADQPPLVEAPGTADNVGCAPFVAGYFSHDAGEWSESTMPDPDLPGAVRRAGPAGAYVQAHPGPAPWLDTPASAMEPMVESVVAQHLVRTPDGYAGRVVVSDAPQPAPCNAVNVIGHGVSREELLQQLSELSMLAHSARASPFRSAHPRSRRDALLALKGAAAAAPSGISRTC